MQPLESNTLVEAAHEASRILSEHQGAQAAHVLDGEHRVLTVLAAALPRSFAAHQSDDGTDKEEQVRPH